MPWIALVVAAAASAAAAAKASSDAKKAAGQQVGAQQDINERQIGFQENLRGANDTPTYLGWGEFGRTMEPQLQDEATKAWLTSSPDLKTEWSKMQGISGQALPYMQSVIGDVQSGAWSDKRQAMNDPVYAARLQAAQVPASAIGAAMQAQKNALAAQNAAAGLRTGSATNRDMLTAELAARNQTGNLTAQAMLQNATDRSQLGQAGMAEQLALMQNMPGLVQGMQQTEISPWQSLAALQSQRASMFQPFSIKQDYSPLAIQAPQYQATLSPTAAVLGSLGSSLGSGASAYMQNQKLNQYLSQMQNMQNVQSQYATSPYGMPETRTPAQW
jgi:hypothetical protein